MSKPYFKSEEEALLVIRKCLEDMEILEENCYFSKGIMHLEMVRVTGRSLMHYVSTITEAFLYLLCCRRLEQIEKRKWPKIHEVLNHCEKEGNNLDCPPQVYEAADIMAKTKKVCDKKTEVTTLDLAKYFNETKVFIEWLKHALYRSIPASDKEDKYNTIRLGADFLISFIDDFIEDYNYSFYDLHQKESR